MVRSALKENKGHMERSKEELGLVVTKLQQNVSAALTSSGRDMNQHLTDLTNQREALKQDIDHQIEELIQHLRDQQAALKTEVDNKAAQEYEDVVNVRDSVKVTLEAVSGYCDDVTSALQEVELSSKDVAEIKEKCRACDKTLVRLPMLSKNSSKMKVTFDGFKVEILKGKFAQVTLAKRNRNYDLDLLNKASRDLQVLVDSLSDGNSDFMSSGHNGIGGEAPRRHSSEHSVRPFLVSGWNAQRRATIAVPDEHTMEAPSSLKSTSNLSQNSMNLSDVGSYSAQAVSSSPEEDDMDLPLGNAIKSPGWNANRRATIAHPEDHVIEPTVMGMSSTLSQNSMNLSDIGKESANVDSMNHSGKPVAHTTRPTMPKGLRGWNAGRRSTIAIPEDHVLETPVSLDSASNLSQNSMNLADIGTDHGRKGSLPHQGDLRKKAFAGVEMRAKNTKVKPQMALHKLEVIVPVALPGWNSDRRATIATPQDQMLKSPLLASLQSSENMSQNSMNLNDIGTGEEADPGFSDSIQDDSDTQLKVPASPGWNSGRRATVAVPEDHIIDETPTLKDSEHLAKDSMNLSELDVAQRSPISDALRTFNFNMDSVLNNLNNGLPEQDQENPGTPEPDIPDPRRMKTWNTQRRATIDVPQGSLMDTPQLKSSSAFSDSMTLNLAEDDAVLLLQNWKQSPTT